MDHRGLYSHERFNSHHAVAVVAEEEYRPEQSYARHPFLHRLRNLQTRYGLLCVQGVWPVSRHRYTTGIHEAEMDLSSEHRRALRAQCCVVGYTGQEYGQKDRQGLQLG